MDKQQATAYILKEYAQGASHENIAIRLSVLVGAPEELTTKFVAQTIAKHTHAATQPVSEAVVKQQNAQFVQPQQPGVTAPPPPATASAVPPATNPSWSPPASPAPPIPSGSSLPASSPAWSAPAPKAVQQPSAEMEAFILKALMKTSKQNEVITMVCERADLNWNDAQRLVARVATQNRKKLTSRQNMIVIPLAVIAILVGIFLVYAGMSEILMLARAVQAIQAGTETTVSPEAAQPMRNAPWAVVVGAGLIAGGGFGLFKAIKAQSES